MTATPYLNFDGKCEEAFEFYANVMRGKITAMFRHEGTPAEAHVPEEWKKKIMYVRLEASDAVLEGGDAPMGKYTKPAGFAVNLAFKGEDVAEAVRTFEELSAGGTVHMPLAETFWAKKFGMFVDKYGTPWLVNCS